MPWAWFMSTRARWPEFPGIATKSTTTTAGPRILPGPGRMWTRMYSGSTTPRRPTTLPTTPIRSCTTPSPARSLSEATPRPGTPSCRRPIRPISSGCTPTKPALSTKRRIVVSTARAEGCHAPEGRAHRLTPTGLLISGAGDTFAGHRMTSADTVGPADLEALFLANLPVIDRIVAVLGARYGLDGSETEEFGAWAREHFIT